MTAKKDILLPFVAFYRWFCACGVTVGANLWPHFLVFERLRTPVTVEADILISLIVFDNWFCKMTKMTFRAIALRQTENEQLTLETSFLRQFYPYIINSFDSKLIFLVSLSRWRGIVVSLKTVSVFCFSWPTRDKSSQMRGIVNLA